MCSSVVRTSSTAELNIASLSAIVSLGHFHSSQQSTQDFCADKIILPTWGNLRYKLDFGKVFTSKQKGNSVHGLLCVTCNLHTFGSFKYFDPAADRKILATIKNGLMLFWVAVWVCLVFSEGLECCSHTPVTNLLGGTFKHQFSPCSSSLCSQLWSANNLVCLTFSCSLSRAVSASEIEPRLNPWQLPACYSATTLTCL